MVSETLLQELPPALGAQIEARNGELGEKLRQEMADMQTIINHGWRTGDEDVRQMMLEALAAPEPNGNPPQ